MAKNIDSFNPSRVVFLDEVSKTTGKPISKFIEFSEKSYLRALSDFKLVNKEGVKSSMRNAVVARPAKRKGKKCCGKKN